MDRKPVESLLTEDQPVTPVSLLQTVSAWTEVDGLGGVVSTRRRRRTDDLVKRQARPCVVLSPSQDQASWANRVRPSAHRWASWSFGSQGLPFGFELVC
jgi:hypothetical protein